MSKWPLRPLGVSRPPTGLFPDFLAALPHERPFCVPCLARMYGIAEDAVRQELQTLAGQIEACPIAHCWTCEQIRPTYRARPSRSVAPCP